MASSWGSSWGTSWGDSWGTSWGDSWGEVDEEVPGQEGETDASDRVIRQSSVISLIRRAAFVIVFLLLLGAQ